MGPTDGYDLRDLCDAARMLHDGDGGVPVTCDVALRATRRCI